MSEIALHPASSNTVTCVPDYFIDEYMVEATGEQVKIFLYLLRCLSRPTCGLSISAIADSLDLTPKKTRQALCYWQDMGLLELEFDRYDELVSIFIKEPETISVPSATIKTNIYHTASLPTPAPTPAPMPKTSEPTKLSDVEFKQVCYLAEKLMGRTFSSEVIDHFLYWHDELRFPWDLIEYIVEYSVDRGTSSVKYMDKIATNYASEGILTVDDARHYNDAYLFVSFAVKNAFGISGRNLGASEIEFVKKWSTQYGFTPDIISEACKRTLLKTHNISFEYADSILTSWNNNGVQKLEDLQKLDDMHKAAQKSNTSNNMKNHNFPQRDDYDFEEIEKTLLQS